MDINHGSLCALCVLLRVLCVKSCCFVDSQLLLYGFEKREQ